MADWRIRYTTPSGEHTEVHRMDEPMPLTDEELDVWEREARQFLGATVGLELLGVTGAMDSWTGRSLRLVVEVRRLREMLKSLEWAGSFQDWPCCPSCDAPGPGVPLERGEKSAGTHATGCALATVLRS
jgi:hypothetical protein